MVVGLKRGSVIRKEISVWQQQKPDWQLSIIVVLSLDSKTYLASITVKDSETAQASLCPTWSDSLEKR